MATNPYTSQAISGYNSSPPADDGTVSAANQLNWSKHKTKLADPIKTLSEGINTAVLAAFGKVINTDANENNAMAGSLAFTVSTLTIASGAVTATRTNHIIAAETGTADTLDTIATGSVSDGCLLTIRPDTGDTITVAHAAGGAGQIHLAADANLVLSGREVLLLQRVGADWEEIIHSLETDTDLGEFTGTGKPDFESAQQTVTVDTILDIAHSLAVIPDKWQVFLVNTTTENGYAVGDEVFPIGNQESADSGVTMYADATNISLVQGASILVHSQSTLNIVGITTASWRWVARAWKGSA